MAPKLGLRLTIKQACAYCVRVTTTTLAAAAFVYWASMVYSDEPTQRVKTPSTASYNRSNDTKELTGYLRKDLRDRLHLKYDPKILEPDSSSAVPTLEQFLNRKDKGCAKKAARR